MPGARLCLVLLVATAAVPALSAKVLLPPQLEQPADHVAQAFLASHAAVGDLQHLGDQLASSREQSESMPQGTPSQFSIRTPDADPDAADYAPRFVSDKVGPAFSLASLRQQQQEHSSFPAMMQQAMMPDNTVFMQMQRDLTKMQEVMLGQLKQMQQQQQQVADIGIPHALAVLASAAKRADLLQLDFEVVPERGHAAAGSSSQPTAALQVSTTSGTTDAQLELEFSASADGKLKDGHSHE